MREGTLKAAVIVGVWGLSLSLTCLALAAGEHSANNILPGCHLLILPTPPTSTAGVDGWSVGMCFGTIDGLLAVARDQQFKLIMRYGKADDAPFCVPGQATFAQVLRVAVAYVEQHPERMHEEFAPLALEALQKAWPCNH